MPAPKEPHPESLTPRVFVTMWADKQVSWGNTPTKALRVYELLKTGEACEYDHPPDPEVIGRFWAIEIPSLSEVNFVRPASDLSTAAVAPQEVLDQLKAAGLKVGENGNIEPITI